MENAKLDEILKEIREVKDKVNDLWKNNRMDGMNKNLALLESKSPVTINELGQLILKEYKGDKNVDSNIDLFIKEIESKSLKTALDVQQYSEKLILSNFAYDMFNEIKNLIYQNPTYKDKSINIEVMSLLTGIYLRDKYLNEHPELLSYLSNK
jgi:hypothetical protein